MRPIFDAETAVTALKGAVGMSATTGGFYVSIMPKIEAWLRFVSLLVGIAVGIATLVSILRRRSRAEVPPPSGSSTSQMTLPPSDGGAVNPKTQMKKKLNSSFKLFAILLLAFLALAVIPTLCPAQDAGTNAPPAGIDMSGAAISFIAGLAIKYPAIITALTVIGILRVLFKPVMSVIENAVASDPAKSKALQTFEAGTVFKVISWVLDFGASIKLKPAITNAVVPKSQ